MGGVGFDVIPTDFLANFIHQQLADATDLVLGVDGGMALSPGTSKTMMKNIHMGMAVRRKGEMKFVGRGFEMRTIDFGVLGILPPNIANIAVPPAINGL